MIFLQGMFYFCAIVTFMVTILVLTCVYKVKKSQLRMQKLTEEKFKETVNVYEQQNNPITYEIHNCE